MSLAEFINPQRRFGELAHQRNFAMLIVLVTVVISLCQ